MPNKRNGPKQRIVDAAKCMPPLYHKLPGQEYDIHKARTLWWLSKQPEVLTYIWDIVKQSGAIKYDSNTGKWQGVDFVPDKEDIDD